MEWITTRRSLGAILIGILLFFGSLAILFWRFLAAGSLQGFSQFHLYTLLALVVAYAAGHLMLSSTGRSIGGVLYPASFFLLFVIATWVCVSLSGASTSESFALNESAAQTENDKITRHRAKIVDANGEREKAHRAWEAAETDVREKSKAAADECASGKKLRCEGRTASFDAAKAVSTDKLKLAQQSDSHYWMLTAQLDQFTAPKVANIQLRQVAKAIAFVGYDEARTLEGLLLYLPYLFATLTEAGSILCFSYGFGHKGRKWIELPKLPQFPSPAPVFSVADAVSTSVPTVSTASVSVPSNQAVKPKMKKQRPTDVKLVHDAIELLGGEAESQDQLAEAMRVHKSETHKRLAECGDFVIIERVGKCNRVRINPKYEYVDAYPL